MPTRIDSEQTPPGGSDDHGHEAVYVPPEVDRLRTVNPALAALDEREDALWGEDARYPSYPWRPVDEGGWPEADLDINPEHARLAEADRGESIEDLRDIARFRVELQLDAIDRLQRAAYDIDTEVIRGLATAIPEWGGRLVQALDLAVTASNQVGARMGFSASAASVAPPAASGVEPPPVVELVPSRIDLDTFVVEVDGRRSPAANAPRVAEQVAERYGYRVTRSTPGRPSLIPPTTVDRVARRGLTDKAFNLRAAEVGIDAYGVDLLDLFFRVLRSGWPGGQGLVTGQAAALADVICRCDGHLDGARLAGSLAALELWEGLDWVYSRAGRPRPTGGVGTVQRGSQPRTVIRSALAAVYDAEGFLDGSGATLAARLGGVA